MNDKSYKNWFSMSDDALAKEIGSFVKHHRLNQNKTQSEIAKAAGVSRSTLSLLERGETVTVATLLQVLRSLNQLQVMDAFKIKIEQSPIELAKQALNKRKRASGGNDSVKNESDW